eukprot:2368763-Amphidinium_carterae.4
MNPTWQGNSNHWRDEIINYEDTSNTTIADVIKTSMLENRLQGESAFTIDERLEQSRLQQGRKDR